MQGRKWLSLLQEDPVSGIRIKPNLNLGPRYLGFSFNSNKLGLRGPCAQDGRGVIFGTSHAMGFAVDVGFDWYARYLKESDWINFGLPVGVQQMAALFNCYYKGSATTALVIYHPNFWIHDLRYRAWARSGISLFSYFRWETKWWSCLKLECKKRRNQQDEIKKQSTIIFYENKTPYYLDCNYSRFDFEKNKEMVYSRLEVWEQLLSPFQRIYIIRIPVKQELIPDSVRNDLLISLRKEYNAGWEMTREYLGKNSRVEFVEPGIFSLSDYYPLDTHWNVSGNLKFSNFVRDLLQ